MDLFAILPVFLMQQLDAVLPSMRALVPAFDKTASQRRRRTYYLYPGRDGYCFCRQRLRCACAATASPAAGKDGRCGACLQARTCPCLDAPMQYELEVMPSVPEEVSVACGAMLGFRLVNKRAYKECKECIAMHVDIQALVGTYRAAARVMADVYARRSVVGMRVGCIVGRCTRCHGSLHQCVCGMWSCECAVCVWMLHRMCDPVDAADPPDDDYRGDKPERFPVRTPAARLSRDKRHDARMLAEYTRLRHRSFVEHVATTPAKAAENRLERIAQGLPVYDSGLDSDPGPEEVDTDEYE